MLSPNSIITDGNTCSHQVCQHVLQLLKTHKLDAKVCDVANVFTMLDDMCHPFLTLLLLAVLAVWLVVVYLLILHVVAQVHKMTQIIDGLFVGNKVS